MATEHECFERLRDDFRFAGQQCENLTRLGALAGGWLEVAYAIDRIEGACRQMAHLRGDTRWLKLASTYIQTKQIGYRLYIQCQWEEFKRLSLVFAQGLARMEALATRATGRAGTLILPETMAVH